MFDPNDETLYNKVIVCACVYVPYVYTYVSSKCGLTQLGYNIRTVRTSTSTNIIIAESSRVESGSYYTTVLPVRTTLYYPLINLQYVVGVVKR